MHLRSFRVATPGLMAAAALVVYAGIAGAQQTTGRITGRIIDASGAGVSDVGIQIVGTTAGTQSGVDGRYSIGGVASGTVTLQLRRLGYAAKTVTGLQVTAGETIQQDISLQVASVKLQTQVVTAKSERGTVSSALSAQRNAAGVVSSVTSEQIARSPDADAAQAVQRVSGVTVQDGKYVFVRGLGERYTTATLNGARIPSPEPERKVVPLDLFPSALIQSVTTSKTFTPDQSGDFSGAQVDIKTKEFPAKRQIIYSASSGLNTAASGSIIAAPGVGGESFALVGNGRDVPASLKAAGNLQSPDITPADKNAFINSFRDTWRADRGTPMPNGSFGASVGGNDPLLGQRIGYVVSGSYSRSQDVELDAQRSLARGSSTNAGQAEAYNTFSGPIARTSALWGGLANFSTLLGSRTHVAFNNTYNRTSDNEARVERGVFEEQGLPAELQILDYVERSVRSNQLAAEHDLGRSRITWSLTNSGVSRDEPDRSELAYEITTDSLGRERLLWVSSGAEGAVRTFSNLGENSSEGRADYQFRFGPVGSERTIKFGGLLRDTRRSANVASYGLLAYVIPESERALAPEQLFGGALTAPDSNRLDIKLLSQGGSYRANDRVGAGFAMTDFTVGSRVRVITGARIESSRVHVDAVSTTGDDAPTDKQFTDVLPSLAVNVKLTESQSLRLSGSRTLARPEYRELARIKTRTFLGDYDQIGNPDLVRTTIDNADVRWEMYPAPGEVFSIGAFAKHFTDPIERTLLNTSASAGVVTWRNADAADDYGVELEARKSFGALGEHFEPLSGFANVTVVRSQVKLGAAQEVLTNANRALVGQAPYVVNTGLTYLSRSGRASATVLYNRVGERIVEAAGRPIADDVKELSRNVVDLSLRFPLVGAVSGRFDARNLADSRYVQQQGAVTRQSYRAGRTFQLGLSWQP